jgi:DNA mismatch repair protein MutS
MSKKPLKLTPMMRQFMDIKAKYPDHILMFRMGDFYEMFLEDAEQASKILNIALTSRGHGEGGEKIALCGFPHHAMNTYLSKLVKAGRRVAICDQLEDPKLAKGIVKRGVTRLVSPGLVLDPETLDDKKPNYLASVLCDEEQFGIAVVELSTGEFRVSSFKSFEDLISEIVRTEPEELIVPAAMEGSKALKLITRILSGKLITYLPDDDYDTLSAIQAVQRQFTNADPDKVIRDGFEPALRAAGGALSHLQATQMRELSHIQNFEVQTSVANMVIDEATKRNLELLASMRDNARRGSLLWMLDRTQTAMGARRLRKWICYPLLDRLKIIGRHQAVQELVDQFTMRAEIRNLLSHIQDLERLSGRVGLDSCNARDLISLRLSLEVLPRLRDAMDPLQAVLFGSLLERMDDLEDLRSLIEQAVHPEPPLALHDGGLIAEDFNDELDELRKISRSGKQTLSELEAREREQTGIAKLKVRYNRVFGYFIEVTKTNLTNVPEHYIRKQTLVNSERFITPELKKFEEKVLNAQEKIVVLEFDLFCKIRRQVAEQIGRIQNTAQILAQIDVLACFGEVAQELNYVCPQVNDRQRMEIADGRHPVVEYALKADGFVPNDTFMDVESDQLLIITGPNMAGKSTYIRQVALIQLMAQIGSFVPATSASLPLVDRIFTRVGASDNLARGESTFMVEMKEAANILADATSRSLVILDEIGRGTSTFDGLAIAWAVAEYLHDRDDRHPMTLFATHYHELTDLEQTKDRVKNYNIAVKEYDEDILFLRKIVPGGTSHSYGISVAKLAGLPDPVIERAREVLANLEAEKHDELGKPTFAKTAGGEPGTGQLAFFTSRKSQVEEEIRALDLNALSPIEAMNMLHRMKKKLS